MLSTFDYHCPHCSHKLNKETQVEFLVRYKRKTKSRLLLAKQPGVYGYKSTHDLSIKNGDKVEFFCPSCEESLFSKKRPEFVGIELWTQGEKYLDLYFSPICGERVTYVDMNGELMRFGSDFFSIMAGRIGMGA